MKKILSLFSFLLLLSGSSFSQNVGIGTTTPAFKVDVKDGSINTDSLYRINTYPVLAITGTANVFIGRQAGSVTTGGYNAFAGHAAGTANTSGSLNAFFGSNAGLQNTIGGSNSFFGMDAGFANLNGSDNSFFGTNAGGSTNSGSGNCFFGKNAGIANRTGYSNIAIGKDALYNNTSANNNIAIGDSALYNQIGSTFITPNIAIGSKAGFLNNTGFSNVFVGDSTGYSNNSGYNNAFFGRLAGYSNTVGNQNSFTGYLAGNKNTSGNNNAFFGTYAGVNNTIGSGNCFIGYSAGYINLSGSGLTMIGTQAAASTTNLSNSTAVGFNAIVGCSNCMALGGTTTNGYQTRVGINNTIPVTDLHIIQQGDNNFNNSRGICLQRPNGNQWRTFIDPSNNYVFQYNNNLFAYIEPVGGTFISSSDERLKKDISPLYDVLNKTLQLQPKTYHYTVNSDNDRHSYGFLAQEVEKLFPEFVFSNDSGIKGIAYSNFSVIAIKAIQEQQELINKLEKKNLEQEQQFQKQLNILSERIEALEKKSP